MRTSLSGWLLLLFLGAAFLRLHQLPQVPPGLTHDEADHGLDAWGVVNGVRPIYFTVGYGREPLFDYSTAGLMAFLGPSYLAGRLTAVFYSLVLLVGVYAWTRRAFGAPVAWWTVVGLGLSFWPIMTGRHALRSVAMPALFMLAWLLTWQVLQARSLSRAAWARLLAAGLLLGATFYTYLPARLMWLLFPAWALYGSVREPGRARQLLGGVAGVLLTAGLVGLPLFLYLTRTPGAEIRLDQLSGPLTAAAAGDFAPLTRNLLASLQLFTLEGDTLWRYNISGRPWLTPPWDILFYLGVVIAAYRALWEREAGAVVALLWLGLGFAPALITGPDASTTRAIALQPIVYLFPALGVDAIWQAVIWRWHEAPLASLHKQRFIRPALAGLLVMWLGVESYRAYFQLWANHPEVRLQYETTLTTMMAYLDEHPGIIAAISSAQPNRFHDPATAFLTRQERHPPLRWFDGQGSLIWSPAVSHWLLFSGAAPLHPQLTPYLSSATLVETLPLRPTDLDRPITVWEVDGAALSAAAARQFTSLLDSVTFGAGPHVTLLGYQMLTPTPTAGQPLSLATWWRVEQPLDGAVLFTHLTGADGIPLAQQDRLDAPSYYWQPGDHFIQLHTLSLPVGLPAGPYTLTVGFYTQPAPNVFQRLPVSVAGRPAGDIWPLTTITIAP